MFKKLATACWAFFALFTSGLILAISASKAAPSNILLLSMLGGSASSLVLAWTLSRRARSPAKARPIAGEILTPSASMLLSRTDITGARRLAEAASANPERHAEELVAWCIDRNYPVASDVLIPFCISNGNLVLDAVRREIQALLSQQDYEGARTLIEYIVGEWGRELVLRLKDELIDVAIGVDVPGEGHNAAALYVLAKHGTRIPTRLAKRVPEILRAHPELTEMLPRKMYEDLKTDD